MLLQHSGATMFIGRLGGVSHQRYSMAQMTVSGRSAGRGARMRSVAKASKKGAPSADTPAKPVAKPLTPEQQRDSLQLHNTLSRQKEAFRPRADNGLNVAMYVCGVTVYDYSHIGHARVYVAFDVLYRLLQHVGYKVKYVRNFTDIDDKIIARAAECGENALELSQRFIEEYHKDMASLRCLPPTLEPKATDFIPEMVTMIKTIISNGHAYVVEGGDVFFDVASLPGYGRLSGRVQEDNRAGGRVAVDGRKRDAADFALWKSAKPLEPSWPSPWGHGRPGWHIECSAMIQSTMGPAIDIHGGGQDLIFPHHENEIAQSAAASGCCNLPHGTHAQPQPHTSHSNTSDQHSSNTSSQSSSPRSPADPAHTVDHSASVSSSSEIGRGDSSSRHTSDAGHAQHHPSLARYWLHNGFVNVDSEKMSKSLGNFFTIRDVLKQYHPLALRWWLVSTQYRQPINYTIRSLDEASDRLYYVCQSLEDVAQELHAASDVHRQYALDQANSTFEQGTGAAARLSAEIITGLLDDLNSPVAIAALSAPLKAINDLLTTKAGRKQADRLLLLAQHQLGLRTALQFLGLWPEDIPALLAELRALGLVRIGMTEEDVQAQLRERAQAREAKDFARADQVRLQLAARGVLVMDTAAGSSWRPGLVDK